MKISKYKLISIKENTFIQNNNKYGHLFALEIILKS